MGSYKIKIRQVWGCQKTNGKCNSCMQERDLKNNKNYFPTNNPNKK
jgi:hypothetical protein